jgi:peptide chain release factor 1
MDEYVNDYQIEEKDLSISWFSGTGKGGQHRNKHQNSCRLTHIPTGIMVTAQTRSRQNSYQEALVELSKRVKEIKSGEKGKLISAYRKEQVGSGMRGDKIRTYRFQDDQVHDHNSNKYSTCKKVMKGNFEDLW